VTDSPADRLRIAIEDDPRATVVCPVGLLYLLSYARLRDTLLKCSAEEPPGIVVDLSGLVVETAPLLSVFTTVWLRISEWPGTPLLLAEPSPPVAELLRRTGVSRFVATYPSRADALDAVASPPRRRRVRVQLSGDVGSAGRARRMVDRTCRDWGLEPLSENARLVASELVSNVLRHAGGAPVLRLEWTGERFVVAVADDDPNPPRELDPQPSRQSGRGLRLVAQVSSCWGFVPTAAGGKVVWASLQPSRARPRG